MQKKVLMAFDDPGGGLAVSSLLGKLENEKIETEIYSGKLSEKFLNKENRVYSKIDSMIKAEDAETIIEKVSPELLITGTGGGNAEQQLRNIAFKKNINSIVILDFWKDYTRRWLFADHNLSEMKDKICVMDELTKGEMVKENFPERNIFVTGHPYLDMIFNYTKRGQEINNFKPNQILFLSQPLHIIGLKDYKIHPLKYFLESLKRLSSESNSGYILKIKLHPSEELAFDLEELKKLYDSNLLKVEFAGKSDSAGELIAESETVAGYNSIALFESRAMNKRTISLNVAPMNLSLIKSMESAGIEIIELGQKNIYDCLVKKYTGTGSSNIFAGGIENCAKIIFSELNLN